jgi:NAD(P)-dependent dehydrogenase (short-subunit alcohol dehydrogenase family)
MSFLEKEFGLKDRVAVLLGGGGGLGSAIAEGFGKAGADVIVTDISRGKAERVAAKLRAEDLKVEPLEVDALDQESLERVCRTILEKHGRIDVLLCAVGGNLPAATTSEETSFFDLQRDALERVIDLNLFGGAILPAQVFGRHMVGNPSGGSMLFISSINAFRPLTRIAGYSAAKAAVSNFTQWLAVHLAREYSPKLRVNALAPGFFLTEQNRYLLLEKDGQTATPRGEQIKKHTPMGRFGDPKDLIGAALWLASDASRFVTGIVVPVDGGFSAYSGV